MPLNLAKILNNIAAPILVGSPIKDSDGIYNDCEIIYVNDAMQQAVSFVIGDSKKWSDFEDVLQNDVPWKKIAKKTIAGTLSENEIPKYYSPSTESWYTVNMSYVPEENYLICTFLNITSERKYYQQLEQSLSTDPLTGLQNRTGFADSLQILLKNANFKKSIAALLILDIDNLKNVNDSIGPDEGDALIVRVAEVIKQFQKENIKIFRYGDDEFAVIMSGFSSIDEVTNFIDCIYETFQARHIEVSGGISFYPNHSEQKDELVRFADMAVHYAKKNGKNNFVYFEPDMQRIFIQQLTMQTRMTTAVLENKFEQYYQPQFDVQTGVLRGFEALIRWNDEQLGTISPSVFIPLAEESGLIIPIGKWVLDTAFATLKKWELDYNFDGVMSVNVSPVQLKQESFIPELKELIEKHKINPNLLEIEVTEGVLIHNMNCTIEKLNAIKDMGIRISLDDFGTGYSSLSYLQKLPLNTLKIDKAFINDITAQDGVQANITSSIINMVDKMGLETIAEGVEHPEQLDLLSKFNCTVVQGFLRGKPMPFNLCDDYLAGNKDALLKN